MKMLYEQSRYISWLEIGQEDQSTHHNGIVIFVVVFALNMEEIIEEQEPSSFYEAVLMIKHISR